MEEEEELKLFDDEIVLNISVKDTLPLLWNFNIRPRGTLN